MILFISIIHIVVALLLIVMVLIQDSKGGGAFGMGATGSNQVFSATGAANFLVKATRWLAVLFAFSCIALTYITTRKTDSVTDDYIPAAASTPVAPAEPSTEAQKPETTKPEASKPAESK
ncbi:MAG: preprotein translocase subunit SecG [Bdellovibrionales bacterium RBG_16_40_8]|nr:MAG: preprotein translocase subunit SecG [Bdellovibrionales bacterium RBG_16_40_8]